MLASFCARRLAPRYATSLFFSLASQHSRRALITMPATKRKRSAVEAPQTNGNDMPPPPAPLGRRTSSRMSTIAAPTTNPDFTPDVCDAPNALRASPDAQVNRAIVPNGVKKEATRSESPLSDAPEVLQAPTKAPRGRKKTAAEKIEDAASVVHTVVDAAATNGVKKGRGKAKAAQKIDTDAAHPSPAETPNSVKTNTDGAYDPEAGEGDEEVGEEEIQAALGRPPPVNSDYLPLPWKGRLGYACLNTYLRNSNPPVFTSRTCRIASILEHRHPLRDPTQPEHPTKNRPDKEQPASIERGQRYVEALCLANIADITKMIRWNDRYNIKFMRLSSELFPFASHEEYGYKLAPFASTALAEAGKVIAELNHRVTTHPGQFTQLGSPRKNVIEASVRDLAYHDELLTLLKLPEQQNKDAVMILHMGGMFEGKAETLDRFRQNYSTLSQSIKNRLVLENCDMGWSVHDLLPICEELNIPLVLDFHHHNIIFDSTQIREGTKDIIDLFPRIRATWERKGITPKMHYSEPTPSAITGRQRRKHSPRVATLPPCPPDMDLMIEAKDKEQAVFELMRTFKLPGYDTFNDVIPHVRSDDNKAALATIAKKTRKTKKKNEDEDEADPEMIEHDDVGMGGPEGRVYWPPGMEEWLRPKKREVKKKDTPAKLKVEAAEAFAAMEAAKKVAAINGDGEEGEEEADVVTPVSKKRKSVANAAPKPNGTATATAAAKGRPKKAAVKEESSPSDEDDDLDLDLDAEEEEDVAPPPTKKRAANGRAAAKAGGRKAKKSVNYNENDDDDMEMDDA